MLKINFLHICEQTILSSDNKVSIINIFSGINVKSFPAINSKFCVIVNTKGEIGHYRESVEIISPNGEPIVGVNGNIEIREGGNNNFVGNFINTPFSTEGKYWIRVKINDVPITSKDEYFILVNKSIQ